MASVSIFFKTYGCQANVADSEGLMTYLTDLGCRRASDERDADVVIVNSCAVREKAEQKMFSYLGSLKTVKEDKPYMRIGVIGCTASYRKKEMYTRFDHVNFIFGAREQLKTFQAYLFDMVTALETTKQLYHTNQTSLRGPSKQDRDIAAVVREKNLEPHASAEHPFNHVEAPIHVKKTSLLGRKKEAKRSFVNITTGCNNYCTFCIVPFTRGREKSYSARYIVDRVKREVSEGAKEVTLIGQNVNSYTDPDTGMRFAGLLEQVAQVPGEFWVRYISPHPKDMTRDVLETMATYSDKLCDWIHLPLQAGDDAMLEKMNRTYTVERYMEIVHWIWDILPQPTISTDIIVGFPGETRQQYEGTRSVMEKVQYDFIFSFVYSRRKYTKAYSMPDDVPQDIKKLRLELLQKREKEISLERNSRHIGQLRKVLVEKQTTGGKLQARTSGNLRVFLEGSDHLIGTFTEVLITHAGPEHLTGSLKNSAA